MIWDRKNRDKDQKQSEFGIASSSVATTGTFFRTTSFHPAEFDQGADPSHQLTLWREAIENPLTNRWSVLQITCQPDLETSGSDDDLIVYREVLPKCDNLSLDEALENLLKYENSQVKLGYVKAGDTAEEYGNSHVRQFALNEGKAPDIKGNVHPCHNGVVMASGTFSDSVLDGVRDAFNNPAKPYEPIVPPSQFDLLFSTDGHIDDISRFIEQTNIRHQFDNLVKQMVTVADMFARLQIQGEVEFDPLWDEIRFGSNVQIKRDPVNIHMPVVTSFPIESISWGTIEKWLKRDKHIVRPRFHNEYFFAQAISEAREEIKNLDAPDGSDLKAFLGRFLDTMELAAEITYAKFMVSLLTNKDERALSKSQVDDQVQYTINRFKKLGASNDDIQRLNAEIIAPRDPFVFGKKYKDRNPEHYGTKYQLDVCTSSRSSNRGLMIYYPEAVFDFLDQCDAIAQDLDQKIEIERRRISYNKAALSDKFTGYTGGEDKDQETGVIPDTAPQYRQVRPTRTPQ